jgi:hypothetical protein
VSGTDVLQHRTSGQRSLVSKVSVKVPDALCVKAGKTDGGRTLVSTDAPYDDIKNTESLPASM